MILVCFLSGRGGERALRMTGHSRWANTKYFLRLRARYGRRTARLGAGLRFEGYSPGGAAILVDCDATDAVHTRAMLRAAFAERGGHLGAEGSVEYLFHFVTILLYPPGSDSRALRRAAIAVGAEDVVVHADTSVEILADPAECPTVRRLLERAGHTPSMVETTWRAANSHALTGHAAQSTMALMADLSEFSEVRAVYFNASLPDEVLNGAAAALKPA
jgi:transcriptional/translational regulatory protein YebC/TACO1